MDEDRPFPELDQGLSKVLDILSKKTVPLDYFKFGYNVISAPFRPPKARTLEVRSLLYANCFFAERDLLSSLTGLILSNANSWHFGVCCLSSR